MKTKKTTKKTTIDGRDAAVRVCKEALAQFAKKLDPIKVELKRISRSASRYGGISELCAHQGASIEPGTKNAVKFTSRCGYFAMETHTSNLVISWVKKKQWVPFAEIELKDLAHKNAPGEIIDLCIEAGYDPLRFATAFKNMVYFLPIKAERAAAGARPMVQTAFF